MRKSHAFDELSDRVCANPACDKQIKFRLVETKDARFCYSCHCDREANRGHTVNTKPRQKRILKNLPVKAF